MAAAEPTLACMILYKDERVHLERIAEKILQVFDQPIFVTNIEGSSDGSEAFLDSMGIEPLRFKWVESFAAARQAGLNASTCDYTLWMDCDDDLITNLGSWAEARAAVKDFLAQTQHPVHWHRVYHADRKTHWARENWFHPDAQVTVKYPTHEVYKWNGSIGVFPPGLLDRVNDPLKPNYKGKHWRYFDMLHGYLKEVDPEDCRCRYYLAAEFRGPLSAKVALYKDFFDTLRRHPSYRNFPEEWCGLYGLFEGRRHLDVQQLLKLSKEQLIRWPFEFLAHFLHAMIRCEAEPTLGNARRIFHVVEGRHSYQRATSGWFRGWYFERALNAAGYYLHKASVAMDDPELASLAVRILEEAQRSAVVPDVLPTIKANLAMARRWRGGYVGHADNVDDEEDDSR